MVIRWLTFSAFHNKIPPTGSTHIRVNQLLKYWTDAGLYRYGENPDVLIFQKVYMAQDYQFPAHFENIKILDMCDADWTSGQSGIKETIDAVDAITVSSLGLQTFVKQLTDKLVIHIPDRFDISLLPKPKVHKDKAMTVVWFGYRHNCETLKPALNLINDLGLDLIVISDDDPMPWQWLPGEIGDKFRYTKYQFIKYNEDNIYYDLQKADFAILPIGGRPIDPFKSNNRTIKAILAGLSVAHDAEQVRAFLAPEARIADLEDKYQSTLEEYDVKKSVEQYKQLIETLKDKRDGRD